MRIQHNIMAMNAYRNYNNNTSALAKNLEKLSSGYRINRAGDDAAGLAISEKMRAQITGLDAAQKNVKDGVSLVKTAEGAMQEIHDMLGRMKYLATQSANGTYDNEVDRANLQKEVESLKSEINRIADSANFNGRKLLNGALDAGADFTTHGTFAVGKGLPDVGQTLGTNTVLETNNGPVQKTSFSVDLHNYNFSNKTGDKMTLEVGDPAGNGFKIELDGDNSGALSGDALANKIQQNNGTVTIKGQDFNVTVDGSRLTFTQANDPTKADEVIDGKMEVKVVGDVTKGADGAPTVAGGKLNGAATTQTSTKATATTTAITAANTNFKFELGGVTKEIVLTAAGSNTDQAKALADAFNSDGDLSANWTAEVVGDTLKITQKEAKDVTAANIKFGQAQNAAATATAIGAATAGVEKTMTKAEIGGAPLADGDSLTIGGKTYTMKTGGAADAAKNEFSDFAGLQALLAKENITVTSNNDLNANANLTFVKNGTPAVPGGSGAGDYNVSTTVITQGRAPAQDRLASTSFELKKEMINEGGNIRIGDETYNFVKEATGADNEIVIGDLKKDDPDYLSKVAERLTQAAANNKTYTVGHDGNRMTFTENQTYKDLDAANKKYDLSTQKGIEESFGWSGANQTGTALNLQIGDSSKDYDQLAVTVKDMHTKALGIDDLDISTQAGAHEAIDKIMDAINNVSSTRGDLGAIQNRLEHTEKNLSVMQESIQDAESAIRDTDVAAEMMKYTKNNILIQSAQAMLAQANQVPQGVLQLLQ